ncbi:RICIN domain-containing protein [Streptomyces sp. HUAS TT7]
MEHITGGSKDNSANVQQYTFNGTDAQKWRVDFQHWNDRPPP